MAPRTQELITLEPTGNIQGTKKVFFLKSLKVLKRRNMIPMIKIDRIIKRVDDWG